MRSEWRVKRYDHVAKSELRQTLEKSLKFFYCRKSIRKQIWPSCRKKPFDLTLCLFGFVKATKFRDSNEYSQVMSQACRKLVVCDKISLYCSEFMLGNCALASPVTSLTGDHVMQIGFGQILPSASSTRDLGTRLCKTHSTVECLAVKTIHQSESHRFFHDKSLQVPMVSHISCFCFEQKLNQLSVQVVFCGSWKHNLSK